MKSQTGLGINTDLPRISSTKLSETPPPLYRHEACQLPIHHIAAAALLRDLAFSPPLVVGVPAHHLRSTSVDAPERETLSHGGVASLQAWAQGPAALHTARFETGHLGCQWSGCS